MNYVIWDWNGTLFNDLDVCLYCINRLLYNNGYKTLPTMEAYHKVFGFPIEDYYRRAGFDLSKKPYEVLAHEYMDIYIPMAKLAPLNCDAIEALEKFKNEGSKQFILSASKQSILNEQVSMFNISHYFEGILGMDSVYASSKKELAYKFLEEHKDIESLIYIGDSYHDLEVANILNAKTFLYSGGHQIITEGSGYTVIDSLIKANH